MIDPIRAFLMGLLAQGITLAIPVVGLALVAAGVTVALGNHNRGKEGIIAALVGGAVILSSQTMATAISGASAAVPH